MIVHCHHLPFGTMYCFMLKLMLFTSYHIVYLRASIVENTTIYVSRGMSTVLECHVDPNSKASWDGPDWESDSKSVKYFDGTYMNPSLSIENKIKIIGSIGNGEYNLEIRNVSARDEGVYKCFKNNIKEMKAVSTYVTLTIKFKPKNPEIHGKNNGKLVGQDGVYLQLLCTVESGIPKETITWYNMSSAIDTGGPAILNTTITPTRFDHKKKYICRINHTSLQEPLQEIVTLDIEYAPWMIFKNDNPLRTNEGRNITIVCIWDSNPSAMAIIYKEDKHINTTCDQSTCSYTFVNISRNDNGLYKCSGNNTHGKGQANITIIVQYPPDINILLNVEKKVIECNPNGIPPNYTYYQWKHLSEYGQMIRVLPDRSTLELESPGVHIDNYLLNGIYVCTAENGISDASGSTVKSGKQLVLMKDKPRFISPTENTQYGRFGFSIDISVSVYCFPKCYSWNISSEKFCCFNGSNVQVAEYNVTTMIFGATIKIKGYKIMLSKLIIEEKHFTTYTFSMTNNIGNANFSVKLISSEKPEAPTITAIIPGHNSLTITWLRNFNGGAEQQFVLVYREISDKKWRTSVPILDTLDTCCVHILKYLSDDTYYKLRLYANNSLGASNFTRVWKVKTLYTAKKLKVLPTITITVFGCFLVIAISALSVFWCHKKGFCAHKETSRLSAVQNSSIQDNMAVENYIYQSHGNGALNQRYRDEDRFPLDEDEDVTAGHYSLYPPPHAFDIEEMAVENHIYNSHGNAQLTQNDQQRGTYQRNLSQPGSGSVISRQKRRNSPPNTQNIDTLAMEDNIYQNACTLEKTHLNPAAPISPHERKNNLSVMTTLYNRGSSVDDLEDDYELQRLAGIDTIAQSRDRHELNYAEVTFGDSISTKASMIHGIHERTIYADIDTTAFVEPVQETKDNSSHDSSHDDDDDDFMYVDGIVDYTKKS